LSSFVIQQNFVYMVFRTMKGVIGRLKHHHTFIIGCSIDEETSRFVFNIIVGKVGKSK